MSVAEKTARARVHCADEHEDGRVADCACGARYRHLAVFYGLAQDLERVLFELWKLV